MSDPIPAEVLSPDAPEGAVTALVDELEAVDAGLDLETPSPRPIWTPADAGAAEWTMSHYAEQVAELESIAAQAAAWREQVNEWERRASARPAQRASFYEGALIRYADAWRAQDPKRRTLHLPSGEVKCTVPTKPRLVVDDHDAAVAWIDEIAGGDESVNPIETAVKRPAPTVLVSVLGKHVTTVRHDDGTYSVVTPDGVPVPGVSALEPADPTYKVTPT